MADVGPFVLKERDLTRRLSLDVEVALERDWRVTLGVWLVRLGARLAGLGYRET